MQYAAKTGNIESQRTDCAVVGIHQKDKLSTAAQVLDKAGKGFIRRLLKDGDFKPTSAATLMVPAPADVNAKRVLLVGLGDAKKLDRAGLRKAMEAAIKAVRASGAKDAIVYLVEDLKGDDADYRRGRMLVEAAEVVAYSYHATKSGKAPKAPALSKLHLFAEDRSAANQIKRGIDHGKGVATGVALARELGDLPGNICTPTYLADRAKKLGEKDSRLKVKVLEEAQMKKLGMGSLLSVSKGSREPAKLIIMEFMNGPKGQKPHVLVGKGLTFDAGGISLKPAQSMDEMKYDMCGGASVFGAIAAVKAMGLKVNVVGIVPASENLPDGLANKPGDVVTSMKGITIEILNTDAEGRLILCDALTYAERYKPKSLIDIATLTGACVIALGNHATGLFSKHDDLAEALHNAGEAAGDRAWRMPVWDDYQSMLKTNFADVANVGGREAGSITAACFLARFTEKQRWAHLDVAGTAWNGGGGPTKGATGRPVPLLVEYLIDQG